MRSTLRPTWGPPGLAIVAAGVLLAGCYSMVGGPEQSLQGQVALTFTGPVEVAVDTKTGSCGLYPADEGETAPFGFMTAVNPSASINFSALELSSDKLTLTLVTSTGTFEAKGVAGALSEDHKTITLDADLIGDAGTEHVVGTVACP